MLNKYLIIQLRKEYLWNFTYVFLKKETDNKTKGDCNLVDKPEITKSRPTIFSELGSTVQLPCETSGNPKIVWLNDVYEQINDPRFSASLNGDLQIANLQWEDLNEYRCVADYGWIKVQISSFLYPVAKV